jgi:hypothetical protein
MLHSSTPIAAHAPTPDMQLVPASVPSSATPLQSLSEPSQTSGRGRWTLAHVHAPSSHVIVPAAHGDESPPVPPQVAPDGGHQFRFEKEQQFPAWFQQPAWPAEGASANGGLSTCSSQSLSAPSQTSGDGTHCASARALVKAKETSRRSARRRCIGPERSMVHGNHESFQCGV